MDKRLSQFIKDSLGRELPRDEIRQALVSAGWRPGQVDRALSTYSETDFPVPVPSPQPYGSAREAFLYLLLYLCLHISAYSFGAVLFILIERGLNETQRYGSYDSGLRGFTSALIVAFPLYLLLSWGTGRMMRSDPLKRGSLIRQWLTYVTLFIAATAIIVDCIVLLNGLLGGDAPLEFVLKVLTVLLIAGLIFGYYLWDIRKTDGE